LAVSRWLLRVMRFGSSQNFNLWPRSVGEQLCARIAGAPLRAYQSEPGRFCHPKGEALEAVIGRIDHAWISPDGDDVLAVATLDATPYALAIDRGLRRMHAHGILARTIGISLVGEVQFSLLPGTPVIPIHRVTAVDFVDLVNHPATESYVLRPLADDEHPTPPVPPAERTTT
jgi:hypothetical protein